MTRQTHNLMGNK